VSFKHMDAQIHDTHDPLSKGGKLVIISSVMEVMVLLERYSPPW
jgi:hypothetical protein